MPQSVTELLLEWQALGENDCFSQLAHAVLPVIRGAAARLLRRSGRFAWANVDEVESRVLDHLRRLHPGPGRESPVALFRPEPDGAETAGLRYVRWLTRRRTQDVVRSERRRLHRLPTLTEVGIDERAVAASSRRVPPDQGLGAGEVHRAVASLPPQRRDLVQRLLEGESQAAIATALGVSEASVSRRKWTAFAELRRTLSAGAVHGEAPPGQPADRASRQADPEAAIPPPFVTVQYRVRHAAETVIWRRYPWYTFACLIEGQVGLTWVRKGSQRTSLQAESVCDFFPPDMADNEFLWAPRRATEFHVVMVPPEYFADVVASEGGATAADLRPMFGFQDRLIAETIRSMRRQRCDGDALAAEGDGRRLVLRMAEIQGLRQPEWRRDEGVFGAGETRRILDFVHDHLAGHITLSQLSRSVGLSPGHFDRKCHRTFGVTPSRLVATARVQRVVDLLATTTDPIEEIARRAGFCSPSHCTNAFRAIVGMPPGRFRTDLLRR